MATSIPGVGRARRRMGTHCIAALLAAAVTVGAAGAEPTEEGFRRLFNGKDLAGWVRVNTAPSTWTVTDGMIVCSGKPLGELRSDRMYQNFILELEWRHMRPRGNSGVFVWADDITARGVPFHRGVEVQVLNAPAGPVRSAETTTRGTLRKATLWPVAGASTTRRS